MSENPKKYDLDSMKKLFQKQKDRTVKEFEKINKKKKQTAGQKEQHELEEKNMKAFIRSIQALDTTKFGNSIIKSAFNRYANSISEEMREAYPDVPKSELVNKLKKSWVDDLSEKERLEIIFGVFGKKHSSDLSRQDFFDELIQTDISVINKFIDEYPDQDKSYLNFFREIAPEKDESKNYNITYDTPYHNLLQKYTTIAKDYAIKKGVDVTSGDNYYDIINKILVKKYPNMMKAVKKGKQEAKDKMKATKARIHKLFAKDLIQKVADKGYDAEKMNIGELITIQLQPSYGKKQAKEFNEEDERKILDSLSVSELVKIATQLNIPTSGDILDNDRNILTNKIIETRRSLIEVEKKDIYNLPNFTEKPYYSNCIRRYNDYGWIQGKVLRLWIAAVPDQKIDSKYILPNVDPIEYDGIVWYPANNKFKVLQCLATSRIQNGNILELHLNNKKYEFMVAYTVHGSYSRLRKYGEPFARIDYKGQKYYVLSQTIQDQVLPYSKYINAFIIQNTELFKDESEYMVNIQKNKEEKIKDILESEVDKNSLEVAYRFLSDSLLRIAPNVVDYGKRSSSYIPDYIKMIVHTILKYDPKDTNKDLFTGIGNIVAYLELPQAKIFRKRIEHRYYTPYNLTVLSPEDKLPEIYGNPKVDEREKEQITHFITLNIRIQVKKMANLLYRKENPSASHSFMLQDLIYPAVKGKIKERIMLCENPERIRDTDPHEIIFYKEGGKQYCFPLKNLMALTELDGFDTINPDTNNKFSEEFIQKLGHTYDVTGEIWSKKERDEYEEKKKDKDVKEKDDTEEDLEKEQKEVFPGLWAIIKEEVDKLDKEGKDEIEDDTTTESSSSSSSSSSSESEEDETEDEDEKENEKTEMNFSDDKIEVEIETKEEEGEEKKSDNKEKIKCEYCQSDVKDDTSYKSIMVDVDPHSDKAYKIVYFCNRQCFENKEKWPKLSKRKREIDRSTSKKKRKTA